MPRPYTVTLSLHDALPIYDEPLRNGPTVILGRKGQGPLGVKWCPWPFWVIDTAYFVTVDVERLDLRYFYYLANYIRSEEHTSELQSRGQSRTPSAACKKQR